MLVMFTNFRDTRPPKFNSCQDLYKSLMASEAKIAFSSDLIIGHM